MSQPAEMAGLTGPGASLPSAPQTAAPQPIAAAPQQQPSPSSLTPAQSHALGVAVFQLRSQLQIIIPATPTGPVGVLPVGMLHGFRFAVIEVMTAFGTMPPPAHHLQLYRLLASPEMRDFITPTGSWAVTIDGSQLASIPADFLAGIAIAIDADAAYSRAGPAPPVAAPVLPSSSLLRAANAAALTPSEQAGREQAGQPDRASTR